MKINKNITEEKLKKYFKVSEEAFEIIRENIISGKEDEAKEIIEMVSNYLSDAKHFEEKGDWVNSFAALNYLHGWMDSGVRLGIFEVGDNDELFTVK
jgi:uncharacterized protein